ncbi:hypothetical protein HEP84_34835 [Streptomyces sp. RLB1-33]|uniref:DAPG hydrolase family protein n=1 Tax=Streptomyces mirabilis TaxID=68239 RepID=UPI00143EB436|nr:hypothetical protein HEP84_34835 [Streptomyces sp. RLB1-33]QUW79469.1 hypothetical protein SMIR_10350 [Streptomyces mirabilis]
MLPTATGVHYVRRVKGGAETRSRFWMGGKYVAPRAAASSWLTRTWSTARIAS